VIFRNFPGPAIFKEKIQDFPGGVGTLSVSQARSQIFTTWGDGGFNSTPSAVSLLSSQLHQFSSVQYDSLCSPNSNSK